MTKNKYLMTAGQSKIAPISSFHSEMRGGQAPFQIGHQSDLESAVYLAIRRANSAQVSAVGVMLTLLLVVTLFSIVVIYYVPVIMETRESAHVNEVEKSFLRLRTTIDILIANDDKDSEITTSVTLGNEGIPMVVPGTMGNLKIAPGSSSLNIYNSSRSLNFTSQGNIRFEPNNRYYVEKNYIYECGGVILEQGDGSTFRAEPALILTNSSGTLRMTMVMVSIMGYEKSISGLGSKGVLTKLEFYESTTYSWTGGETIYLNVTTSYAQAWEELGGSGSRLEKGAGTYGYGGGPTSTGARGWVYNVHQLTIKYAVIEAEII